MKASMKKIASVALGFAVLMNLAPSVHAQEQFSANLQLRNTVIKTNSTIITLPKAPTTIDAFTPTWVFCFTSPCTLEITMNSELSDITPGVDSLRFFVAVDGSAVDVFPTTNLGINSTAKTGQIESGTGTWMRKNLVAGWHHIAVSAAVNDTNGDGFASAYLGDRSLVVRTYSLQ
jgi:hypothetical protein